MLLRFLIKQNKTFKLPMHKNITPLKKTDLFTAQKALTEVEMQPSETTLNKILQFAAVYKVQKISKNQYVEMILN